MTAQQSTAGGASLEHEFEAFYNDSFRRVLRRVSATAGSRAEAEDAVAEAYLRAWDHWPAVRTADNPEAWVRRVAGNAAVSAWRKGVNRLRAHQREARALTVDAVGPDRVGLVHALRQISEHQRRAIVLHHILGLSVEEVSREVRAPIGTVQARLVRGRRALATHLRDPETDRLAAPLGQPPWRPAGGSAARLAQQAKMCA